MFIRRGMKFVQLLMHNRRVFVSAPTYIRQTSLEPTETAAATNTAGFQSQVHEIGKQPQQALIDISGHDCEDKLRKPCKKDDISLRTMFRPQESELQSQKISATNESFNKTFSTKLLLKMSGSVVAWQCAVCVLML